MHRCLDETPKPVAHAVECRRRAADVHIDEMPHVVPSHDKPSGIGEPGTPVIAPPVANAIYATTGKRLRNLPFPPSLA